MSILKFLFGLFLTFGLSQAIASESGVITMTNGRVELLRPVDKAKPGSTEPHALVDGQHYTVQLAKIGTKVERGFMVRTGPDGKARIVFSNGDNVSVGPGTAYQLSWDEKADKGSNHSVLNVTFGKVRALVSKDGPRTGMTVKTPVAVAGVRGTDFFVGHDPSEEKSEVSVLRGEVEVKPANSPKAEPVKVSTGFKAEVDKPVEPPKTADANAGAKTPEVAASPKIELRKATQAELVQIQEASTLKQKPEEIKDEKVRQEVQKLETEAKKTTMEEVKRYDPALYEQIKTKEPKTAQEISGAMIAKLFKEAPKTPEKPSLDSLKDLDKDIYDKYFKEQ